MLWSYSFGCQKQPSGNWNWQAVNSILSCSLESLFYVCYVLFLSGWHWGFIFMYTSHFFLSLFKFYCMFFYDHLHYDLSPPYPLPPPSTPTPCYILLIFLYFFYISYCYSIYLFSVSLVWFTYTFYCLIILFSYWPYHRSLVSPISWHGDSCKGKSQVQNTSLLVSSIVEAGDWIFLTLDIGIVS